MKLDDALAGIDSLGFDSAPIIYFVEAHPSYDTLVTEIFRRVAAGAVLGVTSDALQISVALAAGCSAFLTNDLRLQRVTELRVLALDELEL